jgi:hypothetical protein
MHVETFHDPITGWTTNERLLRATQHFIALLITFHPFIDGLFPLHVPITHELKEKPVCGEGIAKLYLPRTQSFPITLTLFSYRRRFLMPATPFDRVTVVHLFVVLPLLEMLVGHST